MNSKRHVCVCMCRVNVCVCRLIDAITRFFFSTRSVHLIVHINFTVTTVVAMFCNLLKRFGNRSVSKSINNNTINSSSNSK